MPSFDRTLGDFDKLRASFLMSYRSPLPRSTAWYGMKNKLCIVWLIEKGHVDIRTAQGVERIEAGHFVFQMPGLELDQVFSSDTEIMSLRFSVLWETGRSLFQSERYAVVPAEELPELKQAALQFIDLLPKNLHPAPTFKYIKSTFITNPAKAWLVSSAQQQFLSVWYQAVTSLGFKPLGEYSGDKRVDEIVEIFHRKLNYGNVPYKELQTEVGLSRAQIDRLFVRYLRRSPKTELDSIRVQYAMEQLWKDKRPIKQIAFDLGFKSASQFAKWYNRLDGRNPKQVRQDGIEAV